MLRQSILLLSCTVFTGCFGPADSSVELEFVVTALPGSERIAVRNLQFYVHDVVLVGGDGNDYVFRHAASPPWQTEEIALIDLAGADDHGNTVLRGYPAGRPVAGFTGIRFVVGVPFELNHADPLTAAPPLNRTDLLWTWQTGYKFLRVELAEDGREWAFHLGATGCASASAVRPPSAECAEPNRMTVEIRGVDPVRDGVEFQLGELVQAMRAADYEVCVGNYTQTPACAEAFARTGLDAGSGAQRLFGPIR